MLGMNFFAFLLLAVISGAVASLYHYVLRIRFLEGTSAWFGKMLIGWLGAWVGSSIFGHWLWSYRSVYIVPAILGAIAAIHLNVLAWRALARVIAAEPATGGAALARKAAA